MTPSQNCYALIRESEGLVLHPYLDQSHTPTIGFGTTRYPGGGHVRMSDPSITSQQAERYMENDVVNTAIAVSEMLNSLSINQNQFDALVDFTYNEGTGAFHGSTLLKLIKISPLDPTIPVAFGLWDKIRIEDKLVFSSDLAARRKAESTLYFTPISS